MALIVLLAACQGDTRTQPALPPPPSYAYPPQAVGGPLPAPIGQFGRAEAGQVVVDLGVRGAPVVPLLDSTVWAIPGTSLAAVWGVTADAGTPTVELIDVDAGTLRWRDTSCTVPIVGTTESTIVCGEGLFGARALTLDGKLAWETKRGFQAMTGTRVAVGDQGQPVVTLDARTGKELGTLTIPVQLEGFSPVAVCADDEIYAWQVPDVTAPDSRIARLVVANGVTKVAWIADVHDYQDVDACDETMLVTEGLESGDHRVKAIDRATGRIGAAIENVGAMWPARDGSKRVEIATASGIAIYPRDLSAPIATVPGSVPGVHHVVGRRGDMVLVGQPGLVTLLDKRGVAAVIPGFGGWDSSAVMGTTAMLVVDGYMQPAHRFAFPARPVNPPHVLAPSSAVAVPAVLRDMPPAAKVTSTIDTGLDRLATHVAFAANDPALLYVLSGDTLLAFDLRTKKERWRRTSVCGASRLHALVTSGDSVICAANQEYPTSDPERLDAFHPVTIAAFSSSGEPRWTIHPSLLSALVDAAGDLALVTDHLQTHVVDAVTGKTLFDVPSATVAAVRDATFGTVIVSAERGLLVARTERAGFAVMWTLRVAGSVETLKRTGDAVFVQLVDGDAYLVRVADGAVTPLPAIGATWHVFDDLLATVVPSTPSPSRIPERQDAPEVTAPSKSAKPASDEPVPPRLWQPIPPPAEIVPTSQVTLYDAAGSVRSRSDYLGPGQPGAFQGPISVGARTAGSPLVVETAGGHLVIDTATGTPQHLLEPSSSSAATFSTVIDGVAISGAVADRPLRVELF